MIGARDPLGIRPLVLGDLDVDHQCWHRKLARWISLARSLYVICENGEIVVINEDGIESIKPFPQMKPRPCIFEYIYFSRPDSILLGKSVYNCRKNFGAMLAKESYVEADAVTPVPDSGVPAAIGFAEHANIPFEMGIIRNHYVGRTFIEPTQSKTTWGET